MRIKCALLGWEGMKDAVAKAPGRESLSLQLGVWKNTSDKPQATRYSCSTDTSNVHQQFGETMSDTLVPEPRASIFDSVTKGLGQR